MLSIDGVPNGNTGAPKHFNTPYPQNTGTKVRHDDIEESPETNIMVIMIVAPVCAGLALLFIGCVLLVWYMR